MRSSSSNMRSGHLLCLLLSLFGDVSSVAGQGNVMENIVRGQTPLPPSLRSAPPGMPPVSRADAPPEGKDHGMRFYFCCCSEPLPSPQGKGDREAVEEVWQGRGEIAHAGGRTRYVRVADIFMWLLLD